ncbi:acyl-CoA thioesterase [Aureivirga sp. CE67]|uniref:acyl-CoA thioesterase n=1 Tax=Aureivirga sp. CE67 TaxID=1788983 RepID=UPI0018C8E59D|nr:thioesterase family protein [Aureivirga sp. CE67]
MITHQTQIRVRYGETDQMSYVYYGNYAEYFETGRIEWLRNIGISYKAMEESGVMLPVLDLNVKYLKPARYDDLLTVKTTLEKLPTAKIVFQYEIFNENEELLTTGSTTLVFIDMKKNRPIKAPNYFLNKVKNFF